MEVLQNAEFTATPNNSTYTIANTTIYPYEPIAYPSTTTVSSYWYVPTERHQSAFKVAKMLVESKRLSCTSAKAFIELIEELVKVL